VSNAVLLQEIPEWPITLPVVDHDIIGIVLDLLDHQRALLEPGPRLGTDRHESHAADEHDGLDPLWLRYGEACRDMPAECRRATALDRTHHLQLVEAHMPAVGLTPSRTVIAENVRDL
jgi:hypothetical protein